MQINDKMTRVDVNYLEMPGLPWVYLIIEIVREVSHVGSEVDKKLSKILYA